MMSRASFSQKSMEWICSILEETGRQEHVSHLFCARNFNKKGRYISIISIQGKSRTVLIVPEISFNAGWWDLATKIEKFISYKANKSVNKNYRMVDKEIPYAETVRRSKWSSREINSAVIKERGDGDTIFINGVLNQPRNELLGRSLVGSFPINGSEMPTLLEVCRWASKNWSQAHGLNIYEMGNNCFLFQFASINAAEHVLRGRWLWKNQGVRLQWWSPTAGAIQSRVAINQSLIRLVGLPLHLWSPNVFKAVGDFCGGWLKTGEETELRNHLKWARILVKANGISILKLVKIVFEGIKYIIQVWDETPTRFFAGESGCDVVQDRRTQPSNQWLLQKSETSKFTPLPAGDRNFHVGCSKDFEYTIRTHDIEQLKGKEIEVLALDPLAQQACHLNEKQPNISDWTSEPLLDEIQANYRNLVASDRKGDPVHLFYGDRDENFELLAAIRDDDDMSIIQTEERTTAETQTENTMLMEQKAEGEGIIEDIIPLNSDEHETGIAAKNEIPSWVQQNIIRLSKEFGVHFIGCEEAALNLFMKIDGKREAIEKDTRRDGRLSLPASGGQYGGREIRDVLRTRVSLSKALK
ncbi:hypothetical protein H5410_009884 [Solanum commersonii]|uniref:DUF4283 domain-containing protein n=1 Tax=Solanum commersonii TaxID=4109 RepID=A0A9J6AKR9_SOLCO|nr:hypothetical protein H5410_009884 [Solanum commersonii]